MQPSLCNVLGNETADTLATESTTTVQEDRSTTLIKKTGPSSRLRQWLQQHPSYNRSDLYHLLSRSEHVAIFRLRAGHNRLTHPLFTKFGIGHSVLSPRQTLQHDRTYNESMSTEIVTATSGVGSGGWGQRWRGRKLFDSLEDLSAVTWDVHLSVRQEEEECNRGSNFFGDSSLQYQNLDVRFENVYTVQTMAHDNKSD